MQLNWSYWSRSRSRSFWFRSHNSFLVSVSVSLCSGLINKPVEICVLEGTQAFGSCWPTAWRVYVRALRARGIRSNIAGSSLIPTKLYCKVLWPAYEHWSVWASITKLSTADWTVAASVRCVCSRSGHLYRLRLVDLDACDANSVVRCSNYVRSVARY